jgi:hypothetical protein
MLEELEASGASRRRAWENLQEIRWMIKDATGIELPPPKRRTIDLEGQMVKDGARRVVRDHQTALSDLVNAVIAYRELAEKQPLTLQGSEYAHAVLELNKAIDRTEGLLDWPLCASSAWRDREVYPGTLRIVSSIGTGNVSVVKLGCLPRAERHGSDVLVRTWSSMSRRCAARGR